MSKIGKKSIKLPSSSNIEIKENHLYVQGKLGKLSLSLDNNFDYLSQETEISIIPKDISRDSKMKWGLYRSLIQNMVLGVTVGFEQELELVGIGYRVVSKGKNLEFSLGYSHPVIFPIPDDINCEVKGNKIKVNSINKESLGNFCKKVCQIRKQDPYKGKGIYIVGQPRRRKQGKK